MKFKPQAILTSIYLVPEFFLENIDIFLDEDATPYWVSRYISLICIDKLLECGKNKLNKRYLLDKQNDSNKFVKLKAQNLSLKYL